MKRFDMGEVMAEARARRAAVLARQKNGETVSQIADDLGLSHQRVSVMLARARRDEREAKPT